MCGTARCNVNGQISHRARARVLGLPPSRDHRKLHARIARAAGLAFPLDSHGTLTPNPFMCVWSTVTKGNSVRWNSGGVDFLPCL